MKTGASVRCPSTEENRGISGSVVPLVEPCHHSLPNQFSPSSNHPQIPNLSSLDEQPDFEDVSPLLLPPLIPCRVLIDSGAAGNFVSSHLVDKLSCSVHRLRNPVTVRVANGDIIPIGTFARVTLRMHTFRVRCCFHITEMPNDLILGYPFLRKYQPEINWLSREMSIQDGPSTHLLCGLTPNQRYVERLMSSVAAHKYVGYSSASDSDISDATIFPSLHYIQVVDISSEDRAAVEQLTESLDETPPVPVKKTMLPSLERKKLTVQPTPDPIAQSV